MNNSSRVARGIWPFDRPATWLRERRGATSPIRGDEAEEATKVLFLAPQTRGFVFHSVLAG